MENLDANTEATMAKRALIFLAALSFLILFGALAATVSAQTSEAKFGFLKKIEKRGAGWEVKIDYAEFLEGDEAVRAAKEDEQEGAADGSGIYIRDKDERAISETLAADAQIYLLKKLKPHRVTVAQFVRVMRGEKVKGLSNLWNFPDYAANTDGLPCEVTIENGKITKIEQTYLP